MPRFCDAVTQTGRFTSHLAAFCEPGELTPASLPDGIAHRFPTGHLRWAIDPTLRKRLRRLIQDAEIVHIHGLWREYSAVASGLCRAARKPYIVSAHGMLEPWALKNGRWKKRAYLAAIERPVLKGAAGLRALTSDEIQDYRSVGLQDRVDVIPNGIDPPLAVSPAVFLDAFPQLAGQRIVLFLGRIHPKKGIDLLCRAWARIGQNCPDAHLVIAGPDEDNTLEGLVSLVRDLDLTRRVTFTGMLRGHLKWSALAASSLFVLPSHSEGFSVAILEALGSGVPALISHGCHFPEVSAAGAGWAIGAVEAEIVASLQQALSMPVEELREMGERGKQLVADRYTWEAVGKAMTDSMEQRIASCPR